MSNSYSIPSCCHIRSRQLSLLWTRTHSNHRIRNKLRFWGRPSYWTTQRARKASHTPIRKNNRFQQHYNNLRDLRYEFPNWEETKLEIYMTPPLRFFYCNTLDKRPSKTQAQGQWVLFRKIEKEKKILKVILKRKQFFWKKVYRM